MARARSRLAALVEVMAIGRRLRGHRSACLPLVQQLVLTALHYLGRPQETDLYVRGVAYRRVDDLRVERRIPVGDVRIEQDAGLMPSRVRGRRPDSAVRPTTKSCLRPTRRRKETR